jgi:hypothetical protein
MMRVSGQHPEGVVENVRGCGRGAVAGRKSRLLYRERRGAARAAFFGADFLAERCAGGAPEAKKGAWC